MRIHTSIAVLALALTACDGKDIKRSHIELTHSWTGIELPALTESDGNCLSWTLNNEQDIYVNAVTMSNSGGFHHSNWYFVEDTMFDGPDGFWRCKERGFEELAAVIGGGVVAAQSTQATAEVQVFPEGAAYRIPAHSRIVANLHTLNASDVALDTDITLELHAIGEGEVETHLNPMMLTYDSLAIPPHERSRFTMTCDFEAANGAPLDFNFYFMLPHYHELGRGVRFEGVSETGERTMIYERYSEIGEVLSKTLDPAISTRGMQSLRFGCEFTNPRDEVVGSGIGDKEMCIMIAWQDSEFMWAGVANQSNIDMGRDGDGVHGFENAGCAVSFFEKH